MALTFGSLLYNVLLSRGIMMSQRLQKIRNSFPDSILLALPGVSHGISPEQVFQTVVDADPTPRKKYVEWCLRAWMRNSFQWEDIREGASSQVGETLNNFERFKKNIGDPRKDPEGDAKKRSLMSYHYIGELHRAVEPWINQELLGLGTSSTRLMKKMDARKARLETFRVTLDSGLTIDVPLTQFAACHLGQETRWCTAAKRNNLFERYAKDGPLFIFTLPNGDRFQGHIPLTRMQEEWDESESRYDAWQVKSDVQSILQGKMTHLGNALDEIILMDTADIPIYKSDRFQEMTPYMDEVMTVMLDATARLSGVSPDEKIRQKLIKAFRRHLDNKMADNAMTHVVSENPTLSTEQIDTAVASLEPVPQQVSGSRPSPTSLHKKVIPDNIMEDIRSALQAANFMSGNVILTPIEYAGGHRRSNNKAFDVVKSVLVNRLPVTQHADDEYYDMLARGACINLFERSTLPREFIQTLFDNIRQGRRDTPDTRILHLNMYKPLLKNCRETIVETMERNRKEPVPTRRGTGGFSSLFGMFTSLFYDAPDEMLSRLRSGLIPLESMVNIDIMKHVNHLDETIGAGIKQSPDALMPILRHELQNFMSSFQEKYAAYTMPSPLNKVRALVNYGLQNILEQYRQKFPINAVQQNNLVKNLDLSGVFLDIAEKSEDIKDAQAQKQFLRQAGFTFYSTCLHNMKDVDATKKENLMHPVIQMFKALDMPENFGELAAPSPYNDARDCRDRIRFVVDFARISRQVGPGNVFFHLMRLTEPDASAVSSLRENLIFHTYDNIVNRSRYETTIGAMLDIARSSLPHDTVHEVINKASLSSCVIAPDDGILAILENGNALDIADKVGRYEIDLIERDAENMEAMLGYSGTPKILVDTIRKEVAAIINQPEKDVRNDQRQP